MTLVALAKLQHRCERLTAVLAFGTATEIAAARELLRQSLVELYKLGYWRNEPDQFKNYMRLFRKVADIQFNAQVPMTEPGRRARYSL